MHLYTFFDDHFEIKNEKEVYEIQYSEICGVVETQTYFYIKNRKYRPFIIKKENCSEELIGYIRNFKR